MKHNPLPLIIPTVAAGLFFAGLGLSPIWGMFFGVIGVFISNKMACGAWKTTPWGDLW